MVFAAQTVLWIVIHLGNRGVQLHEAITIGPVFIIQKSAEGTPWIRFWNCPEARWIALHWPARKATKMINHLTTRRDLRYGLYVAHVAASCGQHSSALAFPEQVVWSNSSVDS